MRIQDDAETLKVAYDLIPLYVHDDYLEKDCDALEVKGRNRGEVEGENNSNDSGIETEERSKTNTSRYVGGAAKDEREGLEGGSDKGATKSIVGGSFTSSIPHPTSTSSSGTGTKSSSNIAELPVALFRQIVRYTPFGRSKTTSVRGIERKGCGESSKGEGGGLLIPQALKKNRSISSRSLCALDGDKEVSAWEIEAINTFIMARTQLIAASDGSTPTLRLDRQCCEGLASLASSTGKIPSQIREGADSSKVVTIHILYGVLPVHIQAEVNALETSSKCFRERNQSHNNWQSNVTSLSSTARLAIEESHAVLKTKGVQSDRRAAALRLCPLHLISHLQMGLTMHVYDHHSNVSSMLTLQGLTLRRLALALSLGINESDEGLSLVAEGILRHASSLLSISRVNINGRDICIRINLHLDANRNSTQASEDVVTPHLRVIGAKVSDLRVGSSLFVSADDNKKTRKTFSNKFLNFVSDSKPTLPISLTSIPITQIAHRSNPALRNGNNSYIVNPQRQKLLKAKALLAQKEAFSSLI